MNGDIHLRQSPTNTSHNVNVEHIGMRSYKVVFGIQGKINYLLQSGLEKNLFQLYYQITLLKSKSVTWQLILKIKLSREFGL